MKELKKHREVLEEMEKETLTLCKLTGKEHPRVKALRYAIDILGRVEDAVLSALKHEIKAKMPKKDSVPKYAKGSSGETLKLLQMGYNLYADEMEKVVDEL